VALLAGFALAEVRGRDPMLPLSMLRDRTFAGAQLGVFAISGSWFAVFFYMTLYLQSVLGLTPIQTGLAYLPATFTIFAVSAATAGFADRVRPAVLVSGGLALISAGLLAFLAVDVGSSWTVILPGSLIGAVGTGLFNPAASGVALSALPDERSGLAAGANDTFRQTGIALGIAALGAFVPASAIGGSPSDYVDGLHTGLLAAAALAAVGAIGTGLLLGRRAQATAPVPEAA